ncbi:uncharacterized protein LOC107048401 [Diachasma alloeum]|uniref:uncharacterized protein LOC107048401 n=1 Tax=Diachasma alloeum TaxID=454923 RepID=UPI0007382DF3|nr:uncharacterized protein LOC107048401 [Diachasma alloeum]
MRLLKIVIVLTVLGAVTCEKDDDVDISSVFMEAANSFFSDDSGANKFVDGDDDRRGGAGSGLGQVLSGLGNLMASASGGQNKPNDQGGMDLSMLGPLLQMVATASGGSQKADHEAEQKSRSSGFDFESMLNVASMFMGSNNNNNDVGGLMGLLPMILDNINGGGSQSGRSHDHSGHSWYMPPILENIHVMWDHFINSELGQALWKNSGLAHIVGSMTDQTGQIKYEEILESFENPSIRRRWLRSLTNFVAEWISHISDPKIQQRYLTTAQFVGNSFLKSQGFPKSVLFDPARPSESLTRLVNAGATKYLNMNLDSAKYIKPAMAYLQDLIRLASEKGFIMSRVNANELSNRLSETINNDFIAPFLKTYRAYKWALKSPQCATHIFCVINQNVNDDSQEAAFRSALIKLSSYPAAWTLSTKTSINFWTLYGAIQEGEQCFEKFPVDCNDFHEEEIRVTTEAIHNEL